MGPPLRLFGPTHLLILASILVAGFATAAAARRWPALWSPIRWTLAPIGAALGLTWYLFRVFGLHQPWQWALPLEICDLSLWMSIIALVWPRQRLLELAYFWGIAGASMALLTPYLIAPLLSVPSITFLAGHAMIVIAVIFLLRTGRMRPRPGSWIFALLVINGLALFDYGVNRLLGTNYMYLIHKPPIRSLFNVMGPGPWYIFAADALAALLFFLLQLPFRLVYDLPRARPQRNDRNRLDALPAGGEKSIEVRRLGRHER